MRIRNFFVRFFCLNEAENDSHIHTLLFHINGPINYTAVLTFIFPYFKDMDTGLESFSTPAVVPKPPNNTDILLKNNSASDNVDVLSSVCDASKEAKLDSAIKAEASTVTTSPISEETRRFRAAVVSAVRRKCHIPLRKLRSAVLDAVLANGGQLEVRNVRLKLDLPLIRIRQGQWTGELSVGEESFVKPVNLKVLID